MAELLIRAEDPDVAGGYEKGDIVIVAEDGREWGRLEGPPKFVRVNVPGVSVATATSYVERWVAGLETTVLHSDLSIDGHRVEIVATRPGAASQAGVTRDQVEDYIQRWGGTVFSVEPNRVVFDIRIFDAAKSNGFWRQPVTGRVSFADSYNRGQGTHEITANYSGVSVDPRKVANVVRQRGGTVLSHDPGTSITLEVHRTDVRDEFLGELAHRTERQHMRRRFRLPPATVDAILGVGGEVTRSAAEVQAAIEDKTLRSG